MDVKISKPGKEEIDRLGLRTWPIWEKEVSTFPWEYDEEETCYLLEGQVKVTTSEGSFSFGKGDLVTFRQGLTCTWEISEPVRKHYRFG